MSAVYPKPRRTDTIDGPAAAVVGDALVLFGSSSIASKRVRVALRGRLTSDAGVLLLAEVEQRLGTVERLARCVDDPRSPGRVHHTVAERIRFRTLPIAAARRLPHVLRGLTPKRSFWRQARFGTLRLMLIKVAARVTSWRPQRPRRRRGRAAL